MTSLVYLINRLITIYIYILIIDAILSWFPNARQSAFGRFISRLADPYIEIFDAFIPSIGGLSFNVIIGIFVLQLVQRGLIYLL
ncbi:YggT family protein [Aerococcus urinaehominis]|nr:YggT family protein [Aerococcus urinaehominis]SDL89572.1 YggT family protein [Aerococcus urinaehominis]